MKDLLASRQRKFSNIMIAERRKFFKAGHVGACPYPIILALKVKDQELKVMLFYIVSVQPG